MHPAAYLVCRPRSLVPIVSILSQELSSSCRDWLVKRSFDLKVIGLVKGCSLDHRSPWAIMVAPGDCPMMPITRAPFCPSYPGLLCLDASVWMIRRDYHRRCSFVLSPGMLVLGIKKPQILIRGYILDGLEGKY